MPSLKDIRGRIGSVRNIAQITRAMEMVAASRMKRAQDSILAARPYADELEGALGRVASAAGLGEEIDPLLARRPVRRVAIIVITTDRGYRGLRRLAERRRVRLDIKAPPKGRSGFTPIAPLYKIEHTFAQLGRWRRLSRCYEGSQASATAWLEVASVGYLLDRATA